MRIWHYKLLDVLPKNQFLGQLRELVAIMHDWRDNGKTDHILINRVMNYDKKELTQYYLLYEKEYLLRYGKKPKEKYHNEFIEFSNFDEENDYFNKLFIGWHDDEYLRVCMANLYEKYKMAIGNSAITVSEWDLLSNKYEEVVGERYVI